MGGTMIANEEFFGLKAGKVWEALSKNGPSGIDKLCKAARMEENEVWGALGWLGREGKLKIEKSKKNYVYSLAE